MANGAIDGAGLRIAAVELRSPPGLGDSLRRFYAETLGFALRSGDEGRLHLEIGDAELTLAAADGPAFYHFALLVSSGRFEAAREWAAARVELLPGAGDETTFDFPDWSAKALYFHDPAGNIVELIAHDVHPTPAGAPFAPGELEGISEVGLVVESPQEAVAQLDGAGLRLWSGSDEGPQALGFVGRRAHTLIVVATGRGWLPTGRPAEPHPVAVTVAGPGLPERTATVEGHTVTTQRD